MKLFKILFALLVHSVCKSKSLTLNLTSECSNNHVYFCAVNNLTTSYDDPLNIAKSKAPQLSEFIIRNSIITRLPKEIFVQAPNLRAFFMHQCSLNRIQVDDFAAAKLLHTLLLQSNRLSEIPEKVFASAFQLQELYLGNNQIHQVHVKAFAALDKLRYLDLHSNSLHKLPTNLFADLIHLEHIDLSKNNIEEIDSATFAKNLNLKTILLSENKFTVFESDSLEHLPLLHLLDLSYTSLDELILQKVDTLLVQSSELKHCSIKYGAIKIRANNNLLENIEIADKLAVKELELHNNMFESLEDFVGMTNLQKLDISKNRITSLRTSHSPLYLPLPSLTILNLASNQLQNLSADHFLMLPKLLHLDLANNHLLHLEQEIFEPLKALEKLYIEGNRLHRFDYEELLRTHVRLKELGIFSNEWDFPYLRSMMSYLRENNIQLPLRFNTQSSVEDLELHSTVDYHTGKFVPNGHHRYASTTPIEMSAALSSGSEIHELSGVGGIHPYWTTRDMLALATLVIVLLVMLLNLYHILKEENCFAACRRRNAYTNNGGNRPQRLDEEDDSEV